MAVAKKRSSIIPPPGNKSAAKGGEPSLLIQRLKELDREFAHQTQQLTKLTRDLAKKLSGKKDDS